MGKRWILAGLGVVLVAALVVWRTTRPDATVEVVRPERGTMRAWVEERAVTELPHDHLVSMPIAGWLQPIRLREGDPVAEGQVVARLESDDLEDRVLQARQRIEVLETRIAETSDHRLEENALVEMKATVEAIDQAVKAAEVKLDASRALMEYTRDEAKRMRELAETGSASLSELREAELEWRRARATLGGDTFELAAMKTIAAVSYIGPKFIRDYIDRKSFTLERQRKQLMEARTQLAIEERNLARATVASPVDGIVLERHRTRRQFLAAGTPLLTVGRLEELEVVAEVLTEEAARIRPDDPVEVSGHGHEGGPLKGRVLRVHPAGFKKVSSLGVEQQRVNVAITLDRRPEGLGVGFRARVRIFHDEAGDALTVPRTSLFRDERGGWRVLVVRDGTTAVQPVTVGLLNEERAQVTEGLDEDDLVVLRPSRDLEAGLRVEASLEQHP